MNLISNIVSWWYRVLGLFVAVSGIIKVVRMVLELEYAGLAGGVLVIGIIFTFFTSIFASLWLFFVGHNLNKDMRKSMWKGILVALFSISILYFLPLFTDLLYQIRIVLAITIINFVCAAYLIFRQK